MMGYYYLMRVLSFLRAFIFVMSYRRSLGFSYLFYHLPTHFQMALVLHCRLFSL